MLARSGYLLVLFAAVLAAGCATVPGADGFAPGRSYTVDLPGERDGFRRTYRVHVPTGYRPDEPAPLVVVLHGAFSTSEEMEQHTGFSELADREGFVVAYPDGIGILGLLQHWNAGHCCGKAAADRIDDVGFVAEVIEDVQGKLHIDSTRVYMAGFSNGAMLTHRFAAEKPELIAAAAPLAGAIGGDGSNGGAGWQMPTPRSGVPMIMFHGQRDRRIPYGDDDGADEGEFSTAATSSRFWWSNNGCGRHHRDPHPTYSGVTVDTWTNCEQNADVQLLTLHEWGHRWPGRFFTNQGGREGALYGFDASEIIWAFFEKHGRDRKDS